MRKGSVGERESVQLEVSALSSDGAGIARTEKGVIFVGGALPGEIVTAQILSRHKDFSVARVLSVERSAEGRVEPRCPHYTRLGSPMNRCGGCQLQHASYPLQLQLKKGLVRDAMVRIGGFSAELLKNLECVASPHPWGYRNKAAFPVQSIKGRIIAGFYRAGTHCLEWVRSCPVNAAPLNALYQTVLGGLANLSRDGAWGGPADEPAGGPLSGYDERTHRGKLRHIVMRAGIHTHETLLSFVINGKLSARGVRALTALGAKGHPTTLTLNHNSRPGNVILGSYTERLLGEGLITERLGDWTLAFDTTSFFQVNTSQAEQLFTYASALAGEGGRVLELYSGVGSLTCWLAAHNEVTSVEEWRRAVEMAESNLLLNGLEARTLCGKAEDVIEELHGAYNSVVMDPPRDGCNPRVLAALRRFNAPNIVYVSCNPATLARDCKILAGYGYRLVSIRAFDMFPQTAHVETVVLMSRTAGRQDNIH